MRKWLLSKLAPRGYGDRLLHAGNPENPMLVLHDQVSPEQIDALERFTQAIIEAKWK